MTWESAVIIGLCSLNLGSIVALVLVIRAAKLWRLEAWINRQVGPVTVTTNFPKGADMPGGRVVGADPKDNGSVILMTAERDDRLLQGDD